MSFGVVAHFSSRPNERLAPTEGTGYYYQAPTSSSYKVTHPTSTTRFRRTGSFIKNEKKKTRPSNTVQEVNMPGTTDTKDKPKGTKGSSTNTSE